MGLALSVSWKAFAHRSAKALLLDIQKTGFSDVELSFNLTRRMAAEIKTLHLGLGIKIVSVHNFCPIPDGLTRNEALPDCYSIASLNHQERLLAVAFTKKSIDTACLFGARAVVLHCGRVEVKDRTKELIRLCKRGLGGTGKFKRLRQGIIDERRLMIGPFFENALKSLREINAYACKKNVLIGIENRNYYREIPTLDELGLIFNEFKHSNLGYWHDTGHAQIMQELGFARHEDYLKAYASRLVGVHLHDVHNCKDHMSPSQGELDFSILRPYLKKDTIKVIEAHYPASAADIRLSRIYLEKVLDGVL